MLTLQTPTTSRQPACQAERSGGDSDSFPGLCTFASMICTARHRIRTTWSAMLADISLPSQLRRISGNRSTYWRCSSNRCTELRSYPFVLEEMALRSTLTSTTTLCREHRRVSEHAASTRVQHSCSVSRSCLRSALAAQ